MTPDQLWCDPVYRNRISRIAGRITNHTVTLAELVEYRAHITLFRMMGEIGEQMADSASRAADKAEALLSHTHAGTLKP